MKNAEIIYGVNPVLEALRSGRRRCHEVILASGKKEKLVARVAEEATRNGVQVKQASREEIGRLARTDKHQGVAARVDPFDYASLQGVVEAALRDERKAFLLILDGITDPQNLGSLIRTAYLLGVHGVILPRDNAASVTPAVVKASAGATEYLPIVQVTNLTNTIRYFKEKGMWVAAAEASGEKTIYQADFKGFNIVVVLGSEGAGVRRLIKENCDYILSIPMYAKAIESYNVAAAGALFLGEVSRQRIY
ncbi:MAG: 23S rRNA (guanosine(2251)-2'-O)-methyltransferase RlmB [bacterium]